MSGFSVAVQRLVGRLLYAYGLLWLWPFRLTPSRWICDGCSGWNTMRGRWGAFVTSQFGWVRNWRYETLVLPNDEVSYK